MIDRSAPLQASDIAYSISLLNLKLDDLVQEAGVEAARCVDLEATLAAMPILMRRRVGVLLQAVQLNAELNENPAMVFAATYVLALAQEVWTGSHPGARMH